MPLFSGLPYWNVIVRWAAIEACRTEMVNTIKYFATFKLCYQQHQTKAQMRKAKTMTFTECWCPTLKHTEQTDALG